MKQILRNIMLAGCGILLVLLLVFYFSLPSQPDSWSRIQLGMSSDEVYMAEPEFHKHSLKDVKGFDIMTVMRGDSYWQMQLNYDNNQITSLQKRLYHSGLGCFIYDVTIE